MIHWLRQRAFLGWSKLPSGKVYPGVQGVGADEYAEAFVSATAPVGKPDGRFWLDLSANGVTGIHTVTTIFTDTTLDLTDDVMLCDATSAPITVTLPSAVGITGKPYEIVKEDPTGNIITVDPDGTETINGDPNIIITDQYNTIRIVSTGSTWRRLG